MLDVIMRSVAQGGFSQKHCVSDHCGCGTQRLRITTHSACPPLCGAQHNRRYTAEPPCLPAFEDDLQDAPILFICQRLNLWIKNLDWRDVQGGTKCAQSSTCFWHFLQ